MSEHLESINPLNGEVVGTVDVTPVEAIPDLIAKARTAQKIWGALSAQERAERLAPVGARFLEQASELGRIATLEMGRPHREATGEAKGIGAGWQHELDEMVRALAPEVLQGPKVTSTMYRDALGVAACIAPWNFALLMPHWEVLPALMAGNAVILKPSEETPLSGQAYADVYGDALPADLLQVVQGADAQGKALVASDVDLIVFTGSAAVGKSILKASADTLKRVILELGGKDPMIVLKGADLGQAAKTAARGAFFNAGQACNSTERIFVQEDVHDDFVEAFIGAARKMTLGDGMAETTRVGPMVNAGQRDHVLSQLAAAQSAGATVAFAAERPGEAFVGPTVLTGVTPDMEVVHGETFGPLAPVVKFKHIDEAIEMANSSRYGLGAVVYGEHAEARAVGRRLDAGMISVNQPLYGAPGTPWVGAGESGYGFHHGVEGHRQFAQLRVLSEPRS